MQPDLKNVNQPPPPRRRTNLVWFIAGGAIAIILIAVFPVLHQAIRSAEKATVSRANALKHRLETTKATPHARTAQATGPHFDFYQLLKHPVQILTSGEGQKIQNAPKGKPMSRPGTYIVQVASFRQRKQANAMRAQLALWGIQATVQTVNVDDGETWHRVRVGPLHHLKKLNLILNRLERRHIQPLVFRQSN